MSRRGVTLLLGAVLLAILGLVAATLPVPYVVLGPGPTVNTVGTRGGKPVITIAGRTTSTSAGHLNLTTVSVTDRIDLLTGLRSWLDRRYAVVPREEIYPPGRTAKQVDDANAQDFRVSQDSAEVAALHALGYPLQVVVVAVLPGAAAGGSLRKGDVISALDGAAITSARQLTGRLQARRPGDSVLVRYLRDARTTTASVRLGAAKADAHRAALGIEIDQRPAPPLKISFDIKDIGGPSAGLMFSLGIIDLLTPADLTAGRFIAGTGTIDDAGQVGPIGGIHQKLVGARAAGATVFLTPAANCAEARQLIPAGLRLIKVASLREALSALATLRTGGSALPSCAS